MSAEMPKAIFYDSKKTLFDWSDKWVAVCKEILDKYKCDINPAEFKDVWNFYHTYYNHKGAFGANPAFQWNNQMALMHAFKYFGICGDPQDVKFMQKAWRDVPLFPEVEEELIKQRNLCKIIIFSNIETYYLDQLCAGFKTFTPDFLGDMEKAKVSKPNPRAYFWVLEQLGMSTKDVIYCACPQWDLQGALAIGMRTIWLNRDNEPLEGAQPDHIVRDLTGVTKVVESYAKSLRRLSR